MGPEVDHKKICKQRKMSAKHIAIFAGMLNKQLQSKSANV